MNSLPTGARANVCSRAAGRRRDGSRDYEQREAQFKINPWEPRGGGRREEHQDAATLRGIGVQTPGERDAEERLKKKKSLDPSPLSAFEGLGVSFLRYSRG